MFGSSHWGRPWPALLLLLLCFSSVTAAENLVAVTFDDLPFVRINRFSPEQTRQQFQRLLAALNSTGIPALGFVNEDKLYQHGQLQPQRLYLLAAWLNAGYELGNHTYSHLSLNVAGAEAFMADILRGEEQTRPLVEQHGSKLRYFRHPFLQVGPDLATRQRVDTFLAEHHYRVAPVTINNDEWQFAAAYDNAKWDGHDADAERIGQAYLAYMQQAFAYAESLAHERFGRHIDQVLLLHANQLNADYLPSLAQGIRQRGYRFAPLDAVLQDPAYQARDSYCGPRGDSWLHHWLLSVGLRPGPSPAVPPFVHALAGTGRYQGL